MQRGQVLLLSCGGHNVRPVALNQRLRIHLVQLAAVIFALLLLLVRPYWSGEIHEFLESAGFCLVLVCVAGRMWSILYIGSRKNRALTTLGPYSMTRNPLYLFSTIGAVGVGLIFGSILIALMLGLFSYLAFTMTATKEADHLKTLFGPEFDAYAARTPLFWPKFSLYRDSADVAFSPHALKRTFLDGLLFLAIFPLMEGLEYVQSQGFLPVLARLY
ncbi:isoprenylcysteine carboxylmethyltransferase family protein [Kaistia defluvii]|uniref:methyltransferase family protein n=1 Tax=Kaistia defluvii TaxID=410841 RepID=UPI00225447C1|nr:isoprenylcysteine carboxylmethyltransferase family protein [Kaistia defluvii]MCX5519860.1 isoprenylcysteine carboxylmethyltransferase family protein [Kaistia defluvii]